MSEERLRHYREGGKLTHAGVEILPNGKDIELVISHIGFFEKHNVGGREQENVWVAYFAPNPYTPLPMVLNATNRKRLAKISKTDYIQTVHNLPVRMTKEKTKDIQMGGETWGLRISLTAPKSVAPPQKEKEELTVSHPSYSQCVDFLKGGGEMERLENRYSISDELKEVMLNG